MFNERVLDVYSQKCEIEKKKVRCVRNVIFDAMLYLNKTGILAQHMCTMF